MQVARRHLWKQDGLAFFLRLLELKYWQVCAQSSQNIGE